MKWVDERPRGVSPRRLAPSPKQPLQILLTSVKLFALRVNVFYIKNILKQDARHGEGATKIVEGLSARPRRLGVRAPRRVEVKRRKEKAALQERRLRNRITHAHGQKGTRPLPPPSSRGFLTSAPKDSFREAAVLRAGLRSK